MPSVKMLKPIFAYPDGITQKAYVKGEVYPIEDDNILQAIFEAGAGEIVQEPKRKPKAAPSNKAAPAPKENK